MDETSDAGKADGSQAQHDQNDAVYLSIELNGGPPGSEENPNIRTTYDKIYTDTGGIKLLVSLPRLVDTRQANETADVLFEEMSQFGSRHVILHSVQLSSLRFTLEGVMGIQMFLMIHAATVQEVKLHDIVAGEVLQEDERCFAELAKAFEQANNLESLDLSHNQIGAYLWKTFSRHDLKSLRCDECEMDEDSIREMALNLLPCSKRLRSFHFGNLKKQSLLGNTSSAQEAVNGMLQSCNNLETFRWANHKFSGNLFPILGLRHMAHENAGGNLINLELEGPSLPTHELDEYGLCGALKRLKQLQYLKLRLGLGSSGVQKVIDALNFGSPKLVALDLGQNKLDDKAAIIIIELVNNPTIMRELQVLSLESNLLGDQGSLLILEEFGTKSPGLDIRLDGNEFDFVRVTLGLLSDVSKAEQERDAHQEECKRLRQEASEMAGKLRNLETIQADASNEVTNLQQQLDEAVEDRKALIQAFAVIGAVQYVEERNHTFKRLDRLEERVLGKADPTSPALIRASSVPSSVSIPNKNNGAAAPPRQDGKVRGTPATRPGAVSVGPGSVPVLRQMEEDVLAKTMAMGGQKMGVAVGVAGGGGKDGKVRGPAATRPGAVAVGPGSVPVLRQMEEDVMNKTAMMNKETSPHQERDVPPKISSPEEPSARSAAMARRTAAMQGQSGSMPISQSPRSALSRRFVGAIQRQRPQDKKLTRVSSEHLERPGIDDVGDLRAKSERNVWNPDEGR